METITIHQILPTITINDAISNEAMIIYKLLNKNKKFKVKLFASNIHPSLKLYVKKTKRIKKINTENIILLYHFSIGDPYLYKIISLYKKRIMIFHNITPPNFYKTTNPYIYKLLKLGIHQLQVFSDKFHVILSDSLYNKNFLVSLGYNPQKIIELPIIKKFKLYKPINAIVKKYKSNNQINFLFVGRIVPNKKIEDIIKIFYIYKKLINNNANLFLVGKYSIKNKYYLSLKYMINILQIDNIIFLRDINNRKLSTLYQISDFFICMSEHEGFCVPLIESMFHKLPILAFNTSAIPFTLKGSGILFNKKNIYKIVEILNIINKNNKLKNKIIKKQLKNFKKFYDLPVTLSILENTIFKLTEG